MKTLQVKVRADAYAWLEAASKETNFVWNYCNETAAKAVRTYCGKCKWLSAFDLQYLLAGSSALLDYLPAHSLAEIAVRYAAARDAFMRPQLAWRKSGGSKRSLGWVPFRRGQIKFRKGAVIFAGRRFRVFDSYGLDRYAFRSGSFSQNAIGDWFFNVVVETDVSEHSLPTKVIGVDLGLKAVATTSDGDVLPAGRWTYRFADKLSNAQRYGHQRQAKLIHRRIANCRKDALHKFSTKLVRKYGAIYVGDVSSSQLKKTRMAKSVSDAGWAMLRTMLHAKGHRAGCIVEDIDEKYTTQTCSSCGSVNGPKGKAGLVVREWTCADCGTVHDRDVNAARNILARGLSGPSAGTIGDRA